MPVIINKDVTLVKVCKGENKWPITIIASGKVMKSGSHHSEGRKLLLAILMIVDGIWLMVNATVVTA